MKHLPGEVAQDLVVNYPVNVRHACCAALEKQETQEVNMVHMLASLA